MSEVLKNQKAREEQLKEIIRNLHEDSDIEEIRKKYSHLLKDVSPEEITRIEQSLIKEGIPPEKIHSLSGIHVEIFGRSLKRQRLSKVPSGHPVHMYFLENRELRKRLKVFRKSVRKITPEFLDVLNNLKLIQLHYIRKENLLFPQLENFKLTAPSTFMWEKHDEIRDLFRRVEDLYKKEYWSVLKKKSAILANALKNMAFIEEKILLPMALKILPESVWDSIGLNERLTGFCWIDSDFFKESESALQKGKEGLVTANIKSSVIIDLVEYIHLLHKGSMNNKIYSTYEASLNSCSPEEVSLVLDNLIIRYKERDLVCNTASDFIQSVSEHLNRLPDPVYPDPGILLHLVRENRFIEDQLNDIKKFFTDRIKALKNEDPDTMDGLLMKIEALSEIKIHYMKLQYGVFPALEKQSFPLECLKLMWYIQDSVWQIQKEAIALLKREIPWDYNSFNKVYGRMYFLLSSLLFRERKILLPIASRRIDDLQQIELLSKVLSHGSLI